MITSPEGEVLPFRSPTNKSVSSAAARTAPPPVAFACSAIGSAVDSRPEGGGDRRHFADDQRAMAVVCSADWQSAVSRIGNPQGAHDAAHFAGWQPAIQQTNCLRYASGVCDAAFVFQPGHALRHRRFSGEADDRHPPMDRDNVLLCGERRAESLRREHAAIHHAK